LGEEGRVFLQKKFEGLGRRKDKEKKLIVRAEKRGSRTKGRNVPERRKKVKGTNGESLQEHHY